MQAWWAADGVVHRQAPGQVDLVEHQGHRHIGRQPRALLARRRAPADRWRSRSRTTRGRRASFPRRLDVRLRARPHRRNRAVPRCRARAAADRRCRCARAARRAWCRDGGDDGRFVTGEAVQQAGLAGIGTSGQHHGEPVAQQPALSRGGDHRIEVSAHGSQSLGQFGVGRGNPPPPRGNRWPPRRRRAGRSSASVSPCTMLENSPCSERMAARAASRDPASMRSATASACARSILSL